MVVLRRLGIAAKWSITRRPLFIAPPGPTIPWPPPSWLSLSSPCFRPVLSQHRARTF